MSQESVEIVRRAFEAATRKPEPDLETLSELAHPEHDMTTDYGAMGADSFVGIQGFRKALTEFDTDWGQWHQELDEFLDAGDDAVVVLGHLVAQGQSSGIPVEGDWAALVKLREGQIASTRFFLNRDEALEAAGLRE
jgi:ketosteroid isomerase-like protein